MGIGALSNPPPAQTECLQRMAKFLIRQGIAEVKRRFTGRRIWTCVLRLHSQVQRERARERLERPDDRNNTFLYNDL
jgi:hypothetical protein